MGSEMCIRDRGATVADVGCGYPRKADLLLEPASAAITLFDQPSMAPFMAAHFPNFDFVPVDLERGLESYDERFDCVVCADVIEHLLDPSALVELLRQLLRPDGHLFISTPERDAAHGTDCVTSSHPEHVREWNLSEFHAYLTRSGLRVINQRSLPPKRLNPVMNLLEPLFGSFSPARFKGCQLAICQAE